MPTRLSVNVNKVATLRNARGGNVPSVIDACVHILACGAEGITVHPRPDERHIRYADVYQIKSTIDAELNIEGNPSVDKFMHLVLDVVPTQATLVPDADQQLTSDHGWDTIRHQDYLKGVIRTLQAKHIRTSIFVDPVLDMVEAAAQTGTDRIELYTEGYARMYEQHPEQAVHAYVLAAQRAKALGLGVNAGHDLSLHNLRYFVQNVPHVSEVSIGHALIADALYLGWKETIHRYLQQLKVS